MDTYVLLYIHIYGRVNVSHNSTSILPLCQASWELIVWKHGPVYMMPVG